MASAIARAALGLALLLATMSCAHLAPYTPLTRSTRGLDSDAVYRATLRVFARRGWPVESTSADLREVRSQPVPFLRLGLTSGMVDEDYGASVAVRIGDDAIEVRTTCAWSVEAEPLNGSSQACADGEMPEGLHQRELDLVADILDDAATRPGSGAGSGCTRDVECKGARICEDGRCADPPP
jgi:hypothetical protein